MFWLYQVEVGMNVLQLTNGKSATSLQQFLKLVNGCCLIDGLRKKKDRWFWKKICMVFFPHHCLLWRKERKKGKENHHSRLRETRLREQLQCFVGLTSSTNTK